MPRPIKEKPILYDEEAYRFEMAAHNVMPLPVEEQEGSLYTLPEFTVQLQYFPDKIQNNARLFLLQFLLEELQGIGLVVGAAYAIGLTLGGLDHKVHAAAYLSTL